jgi:protein O-mannosyl-transferase
MALDPKGEMSRYNLGRLYLDLGDWAKAQETFQDLLKYNPRNVMGWAALGEVYLNKANLAEAEKCYKTALALQPEAEQVLILLADLAVLQGDLGQARDYYARLEKLQEESDPLNAFQMAKVESLAGDSAAAVAWLERALQRGYDDFAGILQDEELTPIRADGRFAALVQRYFPTSGPKR